MELNEARRILEKNGYNLNKKLCYTIVHCTVDYKDDDGNWVDGYWFTGKDLDKQPTKYNLEDILQELADEMKNESYNNPKKWNIVSYDEATGILDIETDSFVKDEKTVYYSVSIRCEEKTEPSLDKISKITSSLGFNKSKENSTKWR